MNAINTITQFFSKPIFSDKRFILCIWIILAIIAGLKGSYIQNNYLIFKGVFYHTLEQINLYAEYPDEYRDMNHYGPIFSLIIAPFTLLPEPWGNTLWGVMLNLCLFAAIYYFPIPWRTKVFLFYIPLQQLYVCIANCQTNGLIAALIIGSLACIRKEKDFWAACFIALGLFIKLYGVVGLCFFFFSKHKGKFIGYLIMWSVIFFVLPMLISSPSFIIQSYQDWYHSLVSKNIQNINQIAQDISAIGLVRRVSGNMDMSALCVIIPGLILFALQYIKPERYKEFPYQVGILASALLFIVLFSTGSESPTYVIAMVGVGVWFCAQERPFKKWVIALLFFGVLWTWLASSHIFPRSFRVDIVRALSLQSIGSLVVWLVLVYQLITSKGLAKQYETDEG